MVPVTYCTACIHNWSFRTIGLVHYWWLYSDCRLDFMAAGHFAEKRPSQKAGVKKPRFLVEKMRPSGHCGGFGSDLTWPHCR